MLAQWQMLNLKILREPWPGQSWVFLEEGPGRWVESDHSLFALGSCLLGVLGNTSRETKQKCHSPASTE